MPEVAAGGAEAVLLGWPVPEQVTFAAMDAIATVETEKAVVDVPAEADGVILRTLVAPGAAVSVGDPIAVLGDVGESVSEDELRELLGRDSAADFSQQKAPQGLETASPVHTAMPELVQPSARIFSSPLARRIAQEAGLSLIDIAATGPGGRVVRRDVMEAIATRQSPPLRVEAIGIDLAPSVATGFATSALAKPVQSLDVGVAAAFRDVPHTRMRRAIAQRLTQSVRDAPAFAIRGQVRVDKLLRLRAELNSVEAQKVSLNDLVVAAVARAHGRVPALNVRWLDDAVRFYLSVDVAVAVATDGGLVTPVVRDADRLTIRELARNTADVTTRARSAQLRQDEIEGGTITVTNLGVFGTQDFTAILNPPQSAILAVGAAREAVVPVKGKPKVRSLMSVTLSVDHRPTDGATAAKWMACFVDLIEHPVQLLA